MKKAMILLMIVLLLSMVGCSKDSSKLNEHTDISNKEHTDSTINDTPKATEDNQVEYDAEVPLFACQDRSDIEGDRSTIYYYNYKGDLLNAAESAQIGFYSKNRLAPAVDPVTGMIGFVDQSGVFVIDPKWDDAASFSDDGIALVAVYDEQSWYKKCGFINDQGEEIIPCIYDHATSFYPTGFAIVARMETREEIEEIDGETEVYTYTEYKYGVIDKTGNIVIEPQYENIEHIVGDYIVCQNEDLENIYDLTGNLLYSQTLTNDSNYKYIVSEETLTRYTTKFDSEVKDFITITEIFDGQTYTQSTNNSKIQIESRRVATTSTGYGYGVVYNGETVIPFEYDNISVQGTYIVAMKYGNNLYETPTLDIYEENFQKTAEGLKYACTNRVDPIGEQMVLPNGYFDVSVYDANIERSVHGIIDQYGNIIVPLLFYRGIKVYTYEGVGGNFNLLY